MSETIVIFRKRPDGLEGLLRPLPRTAQRRASGISARRISTSVNTVPPTTTCCIAQSDPATPAEYADLLRGTGTAGIQPDRPPPCHARDARTPSPNRCGMAVQAPGDPRMNDETEAIRRQQLAEINAQPGSREALEAEHGQVWDTQELGQDFKVEGFMAPTSWCACLCGGPHNV